MTSRAISVPRLRVFAHRVDRAIVVRSAVLQQALIADCAGDASGHIIVDLRGNPSRALHRTLLARRSDLRGVPDVELGKFEIDKSVEPHRLRAFITPGTPHLDEGRWALYLTGPRGKLERLRPGLLDLRALIKDPGAVERRQSIIQWLPYESSDGFLYLRSWYREAHAEILSVHYTQEGFRIDGRLFSSGVGTTRILVSRRDSTTEIEIPVEVPDDGTFSAGIRVADLVEQRLTRHDDWDILIVSPDSRQRIPVGLILDDIVNRKEVLTFPEFMVDVPVDGIAIDEWPMPKVTVNLYYSASSNLSIYVSDR